MTSKWGINSKLCFWYFNIAAHINSNITLIEHKAVHHDCSFNLLSCIWCYLWSLSNCILAKQPQKISMKFQYRVWWHNKNTCIKKVWHYHNHSDIINHIYTLLSNISMFLNFALRRHWWCKKSCALLMQNVQTVTTFIPQQS